MLFGLDAFGKPVIGQISGGQAAQVPIGWLVPLSEPVRKKPGLPAALQQPFAYGSQNPVVSFGWMEPLSEPVRIKPGLRAHQQQFLAFHPAPSPFVATGWFMPLSEPVRVKPRNNAALYPQFFYQPMPSPFVATGWFAPLSEPVRQKQGLKAHQQQFLASPSRLLPTPVTSGVMSVTETKDTFLAGATLFNRPITGELGVQETRTPGEVSVTTSPAPITARMSITVLP